MTHSTFEDGHNSLVVYPMSGRPFFTARTFSSYVDVSLRREDAPAFALAVLEAAGFIEVDKLVPPHTSDAIKHLRLHLHEQSLLAEEDQLDKEAEALARTHWDAQRYLFNWPKETSTFKDLWLNVARKARELHKTEAK